MPPIMKVFGVTEPVSTKGPDPKDIEMTKKLEEGLKQFNVLESESDLRHRMEVLSKISSLFKEWIKKISISKVCDCFKNSLKNLTKILFFYKEYTRRISGNNWW
jgi:poly(A) polymerase Pap1